MFLIDLLRRRAYGFQVGGVLADIGTGGLELGEEGDLALHLGVALQHPTVGQKAADDVLREVRAIDAQEELSGKALDESLLFEHLFALCQVFELRRIYGDRVSPHPYLASSVPDHTALGLGSEYVGGGLDEGVDVAIGVEGDDVGREEALEHAFPYIVR